MSKKIATGALLVALAMIFSYVEVLIPFNFGVPGMKLGLANVVVVVGLYLMDAKGVLLISVLRIVLVGMLFGNLMSIAYSLAGGLLSFAVMFLMKRVKGMSVIGVSVAGGVSHNLGQLVVAAWVVQKLQVFVYLPALLVAGTVTGILIGVISGRVAGAVGKSGVVSR